MSAEQHATIARLIDRFPTLSGTEIVDHLQPPRQFADATIDSYRPDPDYPSQGAALSAIRTVASQWNAPRGLFGRRKTQRGAAGIYLDGGFGVGKTHLLAALWHAAPGPKYFGTFIEYTALVGAIGYASTVELLTGAHLVCIDEFELDDPGDTRIMSRLLTELVSTGSRIAATSNTPPNALGEGRFAAQDFLREIDALAAQFTIYRIDGLDYRHRDFHGHAPTVEESELERVVAEAGAATIDSFDDLLAHLAKVHPSRYVKLVEGISAIGLRNVHEIRNQTDALRFVAFVDRLYDAGVRVFGTGMPLDEVFADDMLAGGYRKKYLRATSRLIALSTDQVV